MRVDTQQPFHVATKLGDGAIYTHALNAGRVLEQMQARRGGHALFDDIAAAIGAAAIGDDQHFDRLIGKHLVQQLWQMCGLVQAGYDSQNAQLIATD
jgi:hypothetical protein